MKGEIYSFVSNSNMAVWAFHTQKKENYLEHSPQFDPVTTYKKVQKKVAYKCIKSFARFKAMKSNISQEDLIADVTGDIWVSLFEGENKKGIHPSGEIKHQLLSDSIKNKIEDLIRTKNCHRNNSMKKSKENTNGITLSYESYQKLTDDEFNEPYENRSERTDERAMYQEGLEDFMNTISVREEQILSLSLKDHTHEDIAKILNLSTKTVQRELLKVQNRINSILNE